MSDTLQAWQTHYLRLIEAGVTPVDAMRQCGVALETFSRERLSNSAFKAALDLAEAGIGSARLDAVQLIKLREAGADAERCAAYFGMRADEFWAEINKDESLKRAYETGEKRGEAQLLLAQHNNAICGDTNMLKFKGETRMGQITEEAKGKLMSAAELNAQIEIYNQMIEMKKAAQLAAPKVIDGSAVEVNGDEDE